MADLATSAMAPQIGGSLLDRKKHAFPGWVTGALVVTALLGGLVYVGIHIAGDMGDVTVVSWWPYVLLGVALLIALGFEFVNGFHDTANAVATVIYTHSLDPTSQLSGQASAISAESSPPPAQSPSASSPCFPSSSFSR